MSANDDGVIATTDRLLIRPWRLDEAPLVLDILSRIEVIKWLGDGEPTPMKDLDAARESIERSRARSAEPPLGSGRSRCARPVRPSGRCCC